MIPLYLYLKNFLSYGPEIQKIDFTPYHLICLSGKNGHGKSALLDALTWALWGQARKIMGSTRSDQALLKLGQTHMLVALDFIFSGTTYRVRREFALHQSKQVMSLEFGIITPATGTFAPLTEKTTRATQATIDRLLNLDYEAFINSAFLRQGSSNEFSKKAPRDRKHVLANILGLGHYELLRKCASDRSKERIAHKSFLLSLQGKYDTELAQQAPLQQQREQMAHTIAHVLNHEQELAQHLITYAHQKELCTQKEQAIALVSLQIQQTETQEKELLAQLTHVRTSWRALNTKIVHLMRAPLDAAAHASLRAQVHEYQEQLQQSLTLKETLLQKRALLQTLENELKKAALNNLVMQQRCVDRALLDQHMAQQEWQTWHQKTEQVAREKKECEAQLTSHRATLIPAPAMIAHESELQTREHQFEKRRITYQTWTAQGNWLATELASIRQKQKLVYDEDNPSCPLCEQSLSAARKRLLKQNFSLKEQLLQHQLNRLHRVVEKLKKLLYEDHVHLTALKNNLMLEKQAWTVLQELEQKHAALVLQFERHTATEHEIRARITAHTEQVMLAQKIYHDMEQRQCSSIQEHLQYQQQAIELTQLEQKIKACTYDHQVYEGARAALHAYEQQQADYALINEYRTQKEQHALRLHELCTSVKKNRYNLLQFLEQKKQHHAQLQLLSTVHEQERIGKQQLEEVSHTKARLLEEKGRLDHQHEALIALARTRANQLDEINACEQTILDYQAIAHAASKEGIQALLIEEAIPEIELEANRLLARLTNNQAQLFIESLRDLKRGGTRETLDIHIADATGIRPYELFSGGEAFRIDFALRIAIAKLLARRAGASLQTLIIDEGFGSQDDEGLAHIMDALYKIQDDFAKVIIVSHLDTMKHHFPVHFFVDKGPSGSKVSILEQA